MFVPFIFTLEVASDYDHILPFYKYLDMAIAHGWPIIAHERYFSSLNDMAKFGIDEDWFALFGKQWEFTHPKQNDIAAAAKYIIPQAFETEFVARFPLQIDAWIFLLTNNYEPFAKLISEFFEDIEKQFHEPIEGILCFHVPVFLRRAADAKGIPILSQQGGAFRPPFYKKLLFHIDKKNYYSQGELSERYFQLKKESPNVPMLSRKGILKMFADERWFKDIHMIDQEPIYKLGLLLLHEQIGCTLQYSHISNFEMLLRARREWKNDEILVRDRPGFPSAIGTDDSPTSFHFTCKCAHVAGVQSNGLFEAMLIRRIAHGYGESLFTFMENDGIEDKSKGIAPLDFINFVVFACFTPANWITDPEHLRFLLSNPSETEVYMKGFNHYTRHLSPDDLELFYKTDKREYRLGMTLHFTSGVVAHESAFLYFTEGLSVCEGAFTWSDGDCSSFEVGLIECIDADLLIDAKLAGVITNETGEQIVTCVIDGTPVGSITLNAGSESLYFEIPKHVVANKETLRITFQYSNAICLEEGSRKLAVAFIWLRLALLKEDAVEKKWLQSISELNEQLRKLQITNEAQRDEIAELQGHINEIVSARKNEITDLQAQMNETESARQSEITELQRQMNEIESMRRKEIDELQTYIMAMRSSTSWKITKPLRWLRDLFLSNMN